jgi:hypothetical protein
LIQITIRNAQSHGLRAYFEFACSACGRRVVDVRPDFNRDRPGTLTKGY